MKRMFIFGIVAIVAAFCSIVGYIVATYKAPTHPDDSSQIVVQEVSPEIPEFVSKRILEMNDKIVLENPLPLQKISSPLAIEGKARGNWFFEASFPIVVVNWDGLIIGQGIATADGNWMTADFVPFTASVTFIDNKNDQNANGSLILKKDNPSSMPINDDSLEIPIVFSRQY